MPIVRRTPTSNDARCDLCPGVMILWADRDKHNLHMVAPPAPAPAPAPTPAPAPVPVPSTFAPTQAAAMVYQGDVPVSYHRPGTLVVLGRDNYGTASAIAAAKAGAIVGDYLDAVVRKPTQPYVGKYHKLLLDGVPSWPGLPDINIWGSASDFRPGSLLLARIGPVVRQMKDENPHLSIIFADDVGSRPWAAWWDQLALTDPLRKAWHDAAAELGNAFADASASAGMLPPLLNGSWGASGPDYKWGGGYPKVDVAGHARGFGVIEHHDPVTEAGAVARWTAYCGSPQWAGAGHLFLTHDGDAERIAYQDAGAAWIAPQSDYNRPPANPWGDSHPIR